MEGWRVHIFICFVILCVGSHLFDGDMCPLCVGGTSGCEEEGRIVFFFFVSFQKVIYFQSFHLRDGTSLIPRYVYGLVWDRIGFGVLL